MSDGSVGRWFGRKHLLVRLFNNETTLHTRTAEPNSLLDQREHAPDSQSKLVRRAVNPSVGSPLATPIIRTRVLK
jgi:hypothetical protein